MDDSAGEGYAFANNGSYKYVDGEYVLIGGRENYTGERYDKKSSISRLEAAKVSTCHLIDQLLANNKGGKTKVEIGLITFGGTVDPPVGKSGDAAEIKKAIKALKAKSEKTVGGGTNWEGALIKANEYSFNDTDPEYVIFVSDGNPTYRVNANGRYTDSYDKKYYGVYGTGNSDPGDYNLKAAEAAADDLVNHNKQLYAINIFGDAGNMQNLVNNNGSFYRTAADQAAINSTFTEIVKVIKGNLSYADVEITDGITGLTASTLIAGSTSGFTYSVVDKDGNALSSELKKIEACPASYSKNSDGTSSVDWYIGGKDNNFKLVDGATYSVSFLVWPNQQAYEDIADGKVTDEHLVHGNDGWTYETNTEAVVNYSVLKEVTGQDPVPEKKDPYKMDNPDPIKLKGTGIGVEKVWKMSDIKTQKTYIENDSITLDLIKDGDTKKPYKKAMVLSSEGAVSDEVNNTITWKGVSIDLAPGRLVSVYDKDGNEKHPELRGYSTVTDKDNREYYKLGEGHNYNFAEKSDNHKFELEEKTYHPMLVDGKLKNVKFSADGKKFEVLESMENSDNEEVITACNELKFETLTVSNTYTGNMAVAQETTFDLYLFRNKVDEITKKSELEAYTDDDIVSLNFDENKKSGIKLVHQKDGAYRFTIKPDFVDQPKSVSINLPAGVSYQIVEVKDGMPYAEYETKWDDGSKSLLKMFKGNEATNITDVLELSSVNTINFVNTLNALIPTGFADNMLPFIAIAIAGISALGFLAFDFRRRRMFED